MGLECRTASWRICSSICPDVHLKEYSETDKRDASCPAQILHCSHCRWPKEKPQQFRNFFKIMKMGIKLGGVRILCWRASVRRQMAYFTLPFQRSDALDTPRFSPFLRQKIDILPKQNEISNERTVSSMKSALTRSALIMAAFITLQPQSGQAQSMPLSYEQKYCIGMAGVTAGTMEMVQSGGRSWAQI
jgi:hypothetical protein